MIISTVVVSEELPKKIIIKKIHVESKSALVFGKRKAHAFCVAAMWAAQLMMFTAFLKVEHLQGWQILDRHG